MLIQTNPVAFYNLDVIIGVGYRVKSNRGVEFRKWANTVLKDYILKGYAINRNLINTTTQEYQNIITLLSKTIINIQLINPQGQSILDIINNFAATWSTLLQYDEDRLQISKNNLHQSSTPLSYTNAINAIQQLKSNLVKINEATQLFANERNENLQSILAN